MYMLDPCLFTWNEVEDPEFPDEIPGQELASLEVLVHATNHRATDSAFARDDVERILEHHHSRIHAPKEDETGVRANLEGGSRPTRRWRTTLVSLVISSCLVNVGDYPWWMDMADRVELRDCKCR